MQIPDPNSSITAVVYASGTDFETVLRQETATMAGQGKRLAGLIQRSAAVPGRTRCDMYLQDLASGAVHRISEDRGPQARGCVLDTDLLLRACEAVNAGLNENTDLLVLSKFGKAECEGGGFRTLIARALELGVPVLIGVPLINLAPFRDFAGGMASEIRLPGPATTQRAVAAQVAQPVGG